MFYSRYGSGVSVTGKINKNFKEIKFLLYNSLSQFYIFLEISIIISGCERPSVIIKEEEKNQVEMKRKKSAFYGPEKKADFSTQKFRHNHHHRNNKRKNKLRRGEEREMGRRRRRTCTWQFSLIPSSTHTHTHNF